MELSLRSAVSLEQFICGLGSFQEVESFRKQPQINHQLLWLLHAAGQPVGTRAAAGTPSGSCERGCALLGRENGPAMCQMVSVSGDLPNPVSPCWDYSTGDAAKQ